MLYIFFSHCGLVFWCLGSPRLLSLHIVGDAVEGTTLRTEKMYWGGEEGNSVYRWLRVLLLLNFCAVKVFDQNSNFD